jgi:hypothetical protein
MKGRSAKTQVVNGIEEICFSCSVYTCNGVNARFKLKFGRFMGFKMAQL